MRAFLALSLATLVTAVPASPIHNITLTAHQAHANIMRTMPSDRVIDSTGLYDYFIANPDANHTIYLNDTRHFISMARVKPLLSKRQGPGNPCFGFEKHWAEQVQELWRPWEPVSGCRYTGLDSAGGSFGLTWQYSHSIEQNAGLSVKVIEDVLTFTSGIVVTRTWSHGGTYTCNVPGNSVGQIWLQNKVVWGWMWSEGCMSCNVGGPQCGGHFGHASKADGGASAPIATTDGGVGVNYGCSVGSSNVQC